MARFWICVCFVFLMDARLKEFMGLLSIYRLNLFSFSFVFFSCCCPWEVSLDILGSSTAAVLFALPISLGCSPWWIGLPVAGHPLAAGPAGWAAGLGEKPDSRDLSSFHWSLAAIQHLLLIFILNWPLEVPDEIKILLCWPLTVTGMLSSPQRTCEQRGDSTGKGSFIIVTLEMEHGDPETQTCPGPRGKLWLRWTLFLSVHIVGAWCQNVDDFCPLEGRMYLRWVGVPKASAGTPLLFSSRGRTPWVGVWS